ncbi:OFA family MFS transporter [Afifella marina]|uniref:Major Facilitator Superfamily protein n=1 Tax=Afifella marina DSM 2698 TaxID=1120955 RepID=A0A1G5MWX0_AFIMA|nr:OFA family MFS transporter [Afifella marina]MBK1622123.1 MFS transporter [Afifella marina DSM 2698]MBK1628249.1 MFS transporter [Afifella marina]MBK5918907.1 MFS transporter [Afifella marina]RAI17768.1 MFS transporter [Afifella marina DSM 2698]SCZ29685.1 Major Facilitator Superfamily protein [Afifella marina DSM 2698]
MFDSLKKEHIVAGENFNRWKVPPASIAIHLCIGSVYAWSIFNPPLTREFGVVAASAGDWSLQSVVWIFSVAIVFLGLAAAFAGKWLEEVGPRMVGVVAALCWGGGFIVGGLGIVTHQLWLVYLGYGVIGGCGLGLGYVSPVSTLIRWFPDRRGMATGMAIMGFGGGAMIATPIKEFLLRTFYEVPTYLGPESAVSLVTEGGRRMAEVNGQMVEVVVAGAKQVAAAPVAIEPGIYVAGTGNTGAAMTFFTLGIIYFIVMVIASFSYRVPREGWKPAGWEPAAAHVAQRKMISDNDVHIDQALKTPQFYLLWIVLCFNVTAGIGVIGVAKTMMTEIFGTTLPLIVNSAFAATYVFMISVFNMVGRFLWASASDYIGRKNTYYCFFVLGTLLYLSIPFAAQQVSVDPAVTWLVMFYAATMIIFTMYGGGFATIPAYLADIFGTKYVGGIHGRLLTAWSTAGVLGPLAITQLREMSLSNAIHDLATRIDPTVFREKFGAGVEQLDQLIAANTVTIGRLMEIAPAGTVDPTPSLYNTTMYCMAGLLVLALIANSLVRPVHEKHHIDETTEEVEGRVVAAAE